MSFNTFFKVGDPVTPKPSTSEPQPSTSINIYKHVLLQYFKY